MADTVRTSIPKDAWKEISDASCYFQNESGNLLYVRQKDVIPTDLANVMKAMPWKTELYEVIGSEKLWAYSPGLIGECSYNLKSEVIKESVAELAETVYEDGVGTPNKGILAMGTDGTNPQAIKTNPIGELVLGVDYDAIDYTYNASKSPTKLVYSLATVVVRTIDITYDADENITKIERS